MKKLLTLTFAVLAISVQAASFIWSTGDQKISFDGVTFITSEYNATMYLVSLEESLDSSTMFSVDYDANTITTLTSIQQGVPLTTGLAQGKVIETFTELISTDGNMRMSNTFGSYIKYIDSEGKEWYNFSASVYQLPAQFAENDPTLKTTFAFDFDTITEVTTTAQTVTAGGGWYHMAVPEPATASLALLGVALLIKRRRA